MSEENVNTTVTADRDLWLAFKAEAIREGHSIEEHLNYILESRYGDE